jgi:hypothetical protein
METIQETVERYKKEFPELEKTLELFQIADKEYQEALKQLRYGGFTQLVESGTSLTTKYNADVSGTSY